MNKDFDELLVGVVNVSFEGSKEIPNLVSEANFASELELSSQHFCSILPLLPISTIIH